MTLVERVLTEARRYLQVREVPLGSNRGVEIDYFVRECGLDPKGAYPWCACFVGQVGRQALGYQWPCPRTASVAVLAKWAEQNHYLELSPGAGDLFIVWHPELKRFGHVGFVAEVQGSEYLTIEGNAAPPGAGATREGWGCYPRRRSMRAEDRFIRWTRAVGT
jgi:hypothetical protein